MAPFEIPFPFPFPFPLISNKAYDFYTLLCLAQSTPNADQAINSLIFSHGSVRAKAQSNSNQSKTKQNLVKELELR
jgi:hypothetical protein